MYKATDEEARFKAYHDSLRRELNNANWHFTIYKHLDKLRGEYKEEMLEAPEFWGLTQRSHFLDTIMRLNKICDDDTNTINIHKLLNFAEQNIEIFSDEAFERRQRGSANYKIALRMHSKICYKVDAQFLARLRKKYAGFSNTNLKKLRNKAIAHIDKEIVMKDIMVFREYHVDVEQIKEIMNNLDDTLNLLDNAYEGNTYIMNAPSIETGINIIMDALRMDLKERQRSSQAAMKQSRDK